VTGSADINCLILILTAQCNSRCSYCYQTAKTDRSMDWETLRAAMDLALRSESRNIKLIFLGGEPLLEFAGIRRAVQYVQQNIPAGRCVLYRISTNGLLIDDEVEDFLAKHEFEIQLSFDGIEEAQDYRSKGTFAPIDAFLDRLHRRRPEFFKHNLRVCMTVVPAAIPYLSASVRYLIGKGVCRIGISPSLVHHPEWAEDQLAGLDSQILEICEFSLEILQQTGNVPVLFLRKQAGEERRASASRAMCALAEGRRLAVDVDGQVYGCASLIESYQEFPSVLLASSAAPLKLGNLHDHGLDARVASLRDTVARSELFYSREKKHSSFGACRDCRHFGECTICPVSIGYDPRNTDPHRVPDFLCAFNRIVLTHRSRFPAQPSLFDRLQAILDPHPPALHEQSYT
jgi:sulfatase maturation enzyme AslB (radical SAM superfamily)